MVILSIIAVAILGANAFSTKINEALKKSLTDNGDWKYIRFADGTSQTTASTGGGGGGVPTNRTISTTAPLAGGGDLSVDRTLSITQSTGTQSGYLSSTDWTTFNTKQSALGFTPENAANKGAASGYASLNASSLVVQNPVNATATPTASKIPIADVNGKLDGWVTPGGITNITQIANRSYNDLQDIGINTPVQVDAFISSKGAANGLAPLDANGKVDAWVTGGSVLNQGTATVAIQRIVYKYTAGTASHTGDTNETTVLSWTLPGGTMGANGILRIVTYWEFSDATDSKTVRIRLGGSSFMNFSDSSSLTRKHQLDVLNIGTTTAQWATGQSVGQGSWASGSTSTAVNGAVNTDTDLALEFQITLANGSDTAYLRGAAVEAL